MYCSTCGVALAQGLSYCNYCGAKLGGAKTDLANQSSELRPESLLATIAGLFVCGLGVITVLMGVMKAVLGLPVERILAFSLLPFIILLVIEGVFIRLLLSGKKEPQHTSDRAFLKSQATNELDAAHARALPEPLPSVTEQTTRAFDPIYTERKSK